MNKVNSIQPDGYPLVLEVRYERDGILQWARDSNFREDEIEKALRIISERKNNWPNMWRGARLIRVSVEVLNEES